MKITRKSHFRGILPMTALLTIALAPAVLAHGEHDWIRQNDFRDPQGFSCCGAEDCHKLPIEALMSTRDGYAVEFLGRLYRYSTDRVYGSEDGNIWACITESFGDKKPRCLFIPRMF